jgi:hypothetical protein
MFMLLFILMQICADLFIVCLYVLPLENQLSKEEVGAPLTGLTLPHCCACLNQGTVFPSSYVVVFWQTPLNSDGQQFTPISTKQTTTFKQ